MKKPTTKKTLANKNYAEGLNDGFSIVIKALETQIKIQTSGVGSSTVWADWLKYNKEKLLNRKVRNGVDYQRLFKIIRPM